MEFFWIVCSDGAAIPMEGARLGSLLDKMPTLRFLFFGHPQMQPKFLKIRDGAKVVEIPPDLGVTKDDFLAVVHAVLELCPLPAGRDPQFNPLITTLSALGGCVELEDRIREQVAANPLTPAEDGKEQYYWQIVKIGKFATIDQDKAMKMAQLGFYFTTSFIDERNNSSEIIFYYRKRKD